jgi:phage gp36-like protein
MPTDASIRNARSINETALTDLESPVDPFMTSRYEIDWIILPLTLVHYCPRDYNSDESHQFSRTSIP